MKNKPIRRPTEELALSHCRNVTGQGAPRFVSWTMALTPQGAELAAYMEANGITFTPEPAPKNSLVRPVARWFAAHPDEAAALFRQYAQEGEKVSA